MSIYIKRNGLYRQTENFTGDSAQLLTRECAWTTYQITLIITTVCQLAPVKVSTFCYFTLSASFVFHSAKLVSFIACKTTERDQLCAQRSRDQRYMGMRPFNHCVVDTNTASCSYPWTLFLDVCSLVPDHMYY